MPDHVKAALAVARKHIDRAASKADHNPTEAQKSAGNYAKGHLRIHGLDISIENPKGSERKGVGRDGKPWAVRMKDAHYGYIRGTVGADKDHIDVYVGPDAHSDRAWVVDQIDKDTGKFDEHKILLGFKSGDDAFNAYHKAFSDGKGHERIGNMTALSIDQLKSWLHSGKTDKPMNMTHRAEGGGTPVYTPSTIAVEPARIAEQQNATNPNGPGLINSIGIASFLVPGAYSMIGPSTGALGRELAEGAAKYGKDGAQAVVRSLGPLDAIRTVTGSEYIDRATAAGTRELPRHGMMPMKDGSILSPYYVPVDRLNAIRSGSTEINQARPAITPDQRGYYNALINQRRASGGRTVESAITVARAWGGGTDPSHVIKTVKSSVTGGLKGDTPGRADHVMTTVKGGSYILPADHVAHLGQGNTNAGIAVLDNMFKPKGTAPAITGQAKPKMNTGGKVPVKLSDGEYAIPPDVIIARYGNLPMGHCILDKWVMDTRNDHINTLKGLPAPAKSNEAS